MLGKHGSQEDVSRQWPLRAVIKAGLSLVEGVIMTLWVIKRGRATDRATMHYGRAGTIEKVRGFLFSTSSK